MRQLRVGNCSGFYGDRLSAMREMLEGGELDVLTGDYLAELTMLILGRDQLKDAVAGLRPHLRPPGRGLPRARARARREDRHQRRRPQPGRARRPARARSPPDSGCRPRIAYVDGDDVRVARVLRGADRQRLPRRLRHRRRTLRRGRHRGHRPGHRCLARRRAGGCALRLGPHGVRRAGRRRGRGPRAGVRRAGDRRELLGLPGPAREPTRPWGSRSPRWPRTGRR